MGLHILTGNMCERIGSYTYFDKFRNVIAQLLGYASFDGYHQAYLDSLMTNNNPEQDRLYLKGGYPKAARNMPLGVFLMHSDCDGHILLKDVKEMKTFFDETRKRMNELNIQTLPKETFEQTLDTMIELCNHSIRNKQRMEFG